jgi:3-hydroxyisobutyrate dehydrogenase-like beta-hydroxyacid dehydrogenase
MRVGFLGLGGMGSAMAKRLLGAGHELLVWNRSADKADALREHGAAVAPSVKAACEADVVISMLADDRALEAVSDDILENLDGVHCSMSTTSVALSERLTAAHAERAATSSPRQRFVAAPVFGRPDAARAGKLFIVAAGQESALDACAPLFDVMGQRTFRLSERPRDANLVKLSGNFLLANVIEALGEVVALVEKAGVDKREALAIFNGTLFDATAYHTYGKLIVDERWQPAGFTAALGLKDVRLTLAAAEALEVPLPLASLLRDRLLRLLASGGAELDWAALARLAAEDAGRR